MKRIRYTYKDFVTGEIRYTKGVFIGWTEKTGPLNTHYAIFANKCSTVLVPHYCLTPETKAIVGAAPKTCN